MAIKIMKHKINVSKYFENFMIFLEEGGTFIL